MYQCNELLDPTRLTQWLGEAAKIVKELGFSFDEVSLGFCRGSLPLNSMSANQHGTQQGLLMGLAADYVGGLAFASFFPGEPVLGVHDVTVERSMCLWTLGSKMSFLRPASDDVVVIAYVERDENSDFAGRYNQGLPVIADVVVKIEDVHGALVATGEFKYFARRKMDVVPNANPEKPNVMFDHFMKTSARMVAALRSIEAEKTKPLFSDPFSTHVAGKQGHLIASRFLELVPELQPLIAGRTHHADEFLQSSDFQQVVFVGVGFDFRMHRRDFPERAVFEVDLPQMLVERARLRQALKIPDHGTTPASCNLLADSLVDALLTAGLKPELSTSFVFEGCSMYFNESQNRSILNQLRELMSSNSKSRLWMDTVDESLLGHKARPEVEAFLKGMARMGEPFVFGLGKDSDFFQASGLDVVQLDDATPYAQDFDRELFEQYRFVILRATNDQ